MIKQKIPLCSTRSGLSAKQFTHLLSQQNIEMCIISSAKVSRYRRYLLMCMRCFIWHKISGWWWLMRIMIWGTMSMPHHCRPNVKYFTTNLYINIFGFCEDAFPWCRVHSLTNCQSVTYDYICSIISCLPIGQWASRLHNIIKVL